MTFRAKIFLTALATAALAVLVSTALVSWSVRRSLEQRIERDLGLEARMAAEILAHRSAAAEPELDAEADALGGILGARVTFIADVGRVIGDSDLTADQLRDVENHGGRPRSSKRASGIRRGAAAQRDLGTDMLYVAIPVRNPGMPLLAFVRPALPLTDVDRQLAAVRSRRRPVSWSDQRRGGADLISSAPLARRLRAIDGARGDTRRGIFEIVRTMPRTRSARCRACSTR
jgi:hypothetical protein